MKAMEDQVVQEEPGYQDDEESFFQDIDLLQKHGIVYFTFQLLTVLSTHRREISLQNVADIKKLKAVGICTIKGIQMTTRRALCNMKGLSEAKVDKIKEAANKLVEPGFLTAFEYSEKRKMVFHISTGSQEFDKLLGGGIESMAITEAFGEFRTGKTQLSHTLCVLFWNGVLLFSEHGLHKEKSLTLTHASRPDRLRDIADRFNVDHEAVLDNVLYARAYTSEHQMELLDYVAAKFHEEAGIFKLLVQDFYMLTVLRISVPVFFHYIYLPSMIKMQIIDSIMALFRVDFSGRGELAERQQKLAQMLSRLQKISEEYNVAVFVTNQMTADPGATMTFQADPKKPIGGHILAHASTTRISLRKGRGELRIAKIYDRCLALNEALVGLVVPWQEDSGHFKFLSFPDTIISHFLILMISIRFYSLHIETHKFLVSFSPSPEMPENEATFAITAGGIGDAKE
ncbi:Meiotic recombination protein DMC1/LIM15 [Lonchura striata]|uniref:Meiotic recombination protein DMC1/LIM15 n=1 Tax=Lonchura striata TaxID=40157 RepID=A0A218UYS3_9PASE|nr:Meiotic recombination protein DMC1/LIM15 [Lonchura striata domestica]